MWWVCCADFKQHTIRWADPESDWIRNNHHAHLHRLQPVLMCSFNLSARPSLFVSGLSRHCCFTLGAFRCSLKFNGVSPLQWLMSSWEWTSNTVLYRLVWRHTRNIKHLSVCYGYKKLNAKLKGYIKKYVILIDMINQNLMIRIEHFPN